MPFRHLQTRFVLAGALLVATTVGTGAWGALTFARLSTAAHDALRDSGERIDRTAELAGALEREDDALLLALSGDTRAGAALAADRRHVDDCLDRLTTPAGAEAGPAARSLRDDVTAYRAAADRLAASAGGPDALARYQREVNPLLRQAVASCNAVRESAVASLRAAGVRARDEAARATWAVGALSAAAVVLAAAASVWLARSVLRPVRALTDSVEAVRRGDFDRRVVPAAGDELGQLAEGFNRMAESLAEYRRCSLGELLAAKITLEETLNALPEAVLVVAPDGSLAALNPPARSILAALGVPDATHLRELPLRPEHRAAVDAALAGRSAGPPRADFAFALAAAPDGRPRRYLLTAVPIPEFLPRQCGAAVVLDDVTEFARLDELRAELIGVASHELKNPLTSLKLSLALLAERASALAPPQRELLDDALHGCDELAATIDELLDMTRIEAGQLRLDLAPVDLAAVAGAAVRALRPRFDAAGVGLEVVREGPPAVARGDAARLGAVVTNLLTNALKYSPRGGVVTVRVSPGGDGKAGAPRSLRVAVTDAGPGVPPEYRERIFEKFFRVEHHRGGGPNGVPGTGIGLYLCREIVKAHGGTIRCEPGEAGRGTRVAFTLPAETPGG
jgi:NtrC-family two-component system sensor histidine kinase KinB